ncbi:SpvB/TcaC N-terminal domain-containing protein [Chitinophaga sp. Cy-1792]|uniref:SpvB/TcaC N-terminal domain-containing protein n=1 Tax=Chitinophaga sp. Cy-1792 TaxID=2608339 RepID=UPI00141FD605|nr:SpvB/TcaC N-terminal domain-containing protein [Chitinophaga sp. Cy-1792]NIG55419.1 hypothetical protein [Chitinophaga sp. Cy-1792]
MKATSSLNTVKVPDISLPAAGGTVRAADEHYHTNAYTGNAGFSIPIPLPASRALTPSLDIGYSSAAGDGILGMGFHLNESCISIKTNRAYPRYNNEDIYTLDDTELVFAGTATITENGVLVTVDTYLERFQTTFSLIQRYSSQNNTYWKVTFNDNSSIIYGDTPASRIADPQHPDHIFAWYAARHTDAVGNMIQYTYTQLDPQDANIYMTGIAYGNYHQPGQDDIFAFKAWIDYGQLDVQLNENSLLFTAASKIPAKRTDINCNYRAGFAVYTQFLVKHIIVVHDFPDEPTAGQNCITALWQMDYTAVKDAAACTTLKSVTEYGAIRTKENEYQLKALPPILLDFSTFGQQQLTFTPIMDDKGAIFNQPLHLLDLHRDGLPGLLYRNADTLYFYRAKGNGVYEVPKDSLTAPNGFADPSLPMQVVSLEGNGQFQLEYSNDHYSGYYAQNEQGQWQPFTAMPKISLDNMAGYTERLDFSGTSRADELLITPKALHYRASLGLEGMSTDLQSLENIHAVEQEQLPDPYIYYGFENIFGDGMNHRVKITGNTLTVWPCLGYGRFGAPITQSLPITAGYHINLQQRLLMADVSGSGTSDIVYIFRDRITVCFNHGGLAFSTPQEFTFQNGLEWTDTDQIRFTAITGKGNICMVLSKLSPHTYDGNFRDLAHYFYEFNGKTDDFCHKPFLLSRISGNALTHDIRYKSSLQYSLVEPWYTRLPFPVIVVAEEQTTDLVTGTSYGVAYSYRDGYYDPVSHGFFGFGSTTRKDITTDTPGTLTKTWFHLGNGLDEDKMKAQFFNGGNDYQLIPASITEEKDLTALSGKILHEEAYGLDDMSCPFTAESSSWQLICTQPATKATKAVYRSYDCQAVSFNYERRADDPLIHHACILLADQYTHTLCSASLTYPRRTPLIPEQAIQYCTGNAYTLKNQDTAGLPRRIGVPLRVESFEITGIPPAADGIYRYEALQQQLVDDKGFLHRLPPSGIPGDTTAARLLSCDHQYYWADEKQLAVWQEDMPLPAVLLEQYTATLAFDDTDINKILPGNGHPEELSTAGFWRDNAGLWWTRTARATYEALPGFCLLKQLQYDWVDITDTLYTSTQITHDIYFLHAIASSQWLNKEISLTTRATIDYRVMQPYRITDINGNYNEALFDARGEIIATASIDKSRKSGDQPLQDFKQQPVTDPGDVMAHPLHYLQGAASFVYYQFATQHNGQWLPGFTMVLSRTEYKSAEDTTVQRAVSYSDGLGRHLETKAFKGETGAMWMTSGRVTYDSAGNVKEQYLGYFSDSWTYNADWDGRILPTPAKFTYDATGRLLSTLTPKGFITASQVLNAWESRDYDENDTILESPYYKSGAWNNNPQEKDAVTKAVACYNTPATIVSDGLGRAILSIADNTSGKTSPINWQQTRLGAAEINAAAPALEVSRQSFDILGRLLWQQDARFTEQNNATYNIEHIYPVSTGLFYTNSSDSGITYGYTNVHGLKHSQWDALGIKHTVAYDNLQRQVSITVQTPAGYSPAVNQPVDIKIYGEHHPAAMEANMMGTLWKHYNDGGLSYVDALTFDHFAVNEHFRFKKDYKQASDWHTLSDDMLEAEVFTTVNTHDAAGKLLSSTAPDGTVSSWAYSTLGYCRKSGVQVQGTGSIQPVLTNVQVDANGLLTHISYANNILTQQQHDPLTLEVAGIQCTRNGTLIQDLQLWHDPAGHVTSALNAQQQSVFFNNQQVNPVFSWTYDAVYRLRIATGRLQLQKGSLASLEQYTENYQYDKSDNLTQLKRTCANGFTRQFTIADKSNRITGLTIGKENFTIAYNAAGYMKNTADTNSSTLSWNITGNVSSATVVAREDGLADAEYYVYSNGIRVRKVTEKYDADGKLLTLTDKRYTGTYQRTTSTTGNTMHSISIGGASQRDCLLQYFTVPATTKITAPAIYRFQQVENITVFSMETNIDGGLISYEEYNPFGETVYSYDPAHLDSTREYRYSQQEKDLFTGLYYYGYRYYAPWLCRWTRPDPAGPVDGLNLYAFVSNDPVGNIDVLGFATQNKTKKRNAKRQPAKNAGRKGKTTTARSTKKPVTAAVMQQRIVAEQQGTVPKKPKRKFVKPPTRSLRLKAIETKERAAAIATAQGLTGYDRIVAKVTEREILKTDNGDFGQLIKRKMKDQKGINESLVNTTEIDEVTNLIDFNKEFYSHNITIDNNTGRKIFYAYGKIFPAAQIKADRQPIDKQMPPNLNTEIHDRGHLIWQSGNKHEEIDTETNLIAENSKVNQFTKTAYERRTQKRASKYEVHHLSIPQWDANNNVTGVYHFSFANRKFREGIYIANPQRKLLFHR